MIISKKRLVLIGYISIIVFCAVILIGSIWFAWQCVEVISQRGLENILTEIWTGSGIK